MHSPVCRANRASRSLYAYRIGNSPTIYRPRLALRKFVKNSHCSCTFRALPLQLRLMQWINIEIYLKKMQRYTLLTMFQVETKFFVIGYIDFLIRKIKKINFTIYQSFIKKIALNCAILYIFYCFNSTLENVIFKIIKSLILNDN